MRLRLHFHGCIAFLLLLLAIPVSTAPTEISEDALNDTTKGSEEKNLLPFDDDSEQENEDDVNEEDLLDEQELSNRENFFDETLEKTLQQTFDSNKDTKISFPSIIDKSFNNKKSFACSRSKPELSTGTSTADLSPEDIDIIAAMGDSLSTGIGLWPHTKIEFRGASFSSGGDATIDGLVTIPNILRTFNPNLLGVSHGMGSAEELPDHQLNVAQSGGKQRDLPKQATELVERLGKLRDVDYRQRWVMIIITVGTEEMCYSCSGADFNALRTTINILQQGIPKAFIILLGPLHVSPMRLQNENWLSKRCECLQEHSERVIKNWTTVFDNLEEIYSSSGKTTFGFEALPFLTITSRLPRSLFIAQTPLLNRRGHMYATKWLWNRLIKGDKYNLTSAVLSSDSFSCPPIGCPFFRTHANSVKCTTISSDKAKDVVLVVNDGAAEEKKKRTPKRLYMIALIIVLVAFSLVFMLGTIFYQKSKQGDHGRFEVVEEAQLKFEEAKKEEEQKLLVRQNTRALSTDVLSRSTSFSSRRVVSECEP